ncbi:putative Plus-3 domain-containing protein [Medicago truncatula]|uniref:Putative Plus-3 domain-containing protein n=1 Tax=Medicago truncatula TaxID=3880 RepID=A0A396ITN6_MEDTR|nr:putative Plus-3 domain-containing protein [Medicago truncatula]
MICGSEEMDDNKAFKFPKQRNLNSATKSCQSAVSEKLPSGYAAIISSNLKLVYLKRTLIEELRKQPETFDDKVLGCFVRTKTDPNDYLQKNSHLLVQVIGINRSNKTNQEILLQLSNVPKDVPISKISDDDFSEEECQDLYQRMANGLLKKPTIVSLMCVSDLVFSMCHKKKLCLII